MRWQATVSRCKSLVGSQNRVTEQRLPMPLYQSTRVWGTVCARLDGVNAHVSVQCLPKTENRTLPNGQTVSKRRLVDLNGF
jgi:hypothetical protein